METANQSGNSPQEVARRSDTHEQQPQGVAFVKGAKRKRLSKACDACHKSKRRCDGTSPCSNCYFASKTCTYTDSSGRPVPAPRNTAHDNAPNSQTSPQELTSVDLSPRQVDNVASKKRPWVDTPEPSSATPSPSTSLTLQAGQLEPARQSSLLDPTITHELVNLFFAHCNPQRLIIHKPSFSSALSLNKVPPYLILAVCALAAPMSKTLGARAPLPRLAGVPFFQEAVAMMFDSSGRLLSEPSLATAQCLCLLELHEIAASHSWTKHYRYFDLALQLLEDGLEVHKPDSPTLASPGTPEALNRLIERECTRRCFWLIQAMEWINTIYTYKPMRVRSVELMPHVRLPIDETNFELAVDKASVAEYLHITAPRSRYASPFGHMCRILAIYSTLEMTLVSKEGPARDASVAESRRALETWVDSLPDHLRFSEDNLDHQTAMFETSSNSAAWCYCFMHVLHPLCYLSLLEGEGMCGEPIAWVRNQLNLIFNAAGTRAKNTILSACALWSYSKYHPDDPQLEVWDRDFEKVWGFKVAVVAQQWRDCQKQQRAQAAANTLTSSPPRDAVHTSSASPTAAISAPASQFTYSAPVSGGRRDDAAGLSAYSQPSEPDRSAHAYAQTARSQRDAHLNLPSLKASGLLDSWKPPSEAFASSLAISVAAQTGRDEERRAPPSVPFHTHAHAHAHGSVAQPARGGVPASGIAMPVGLTWLERDSM